LKFWPAEGFVNHKDNQGTADTVSAQAYLQRTMKGKRL